MVRKLSLCVFFMQIWINRVESQFENLFGGALGNNLGGGNGGNSLFGGRNGGFGRANNGFGGVNGGFGSANGGFGSANGGFGSANGGFGSMNGGVSRRPFWFRSSRLNRVVEAVVHPNARPTPEILYIAYMHRGSPKTLMEMMEYIPHFARLALDYGVQHPNVTNGVPTLQQMSDLMMRRGRAYYRSTQSENASSSRSRRRNRNGNSGNTGVVAASVTSGNDNPTNTGPMRSANPQSQNLAGPAYNTYNASQNNVQGAIINVTQTEQSVGTGGNAQIQNNGGNALLENLLMLHLFSQPNAAAGGPEGNPLMSMLGPLLSSNENHFMIGGLNLFMMNTNENAMIPMANNANPLMLMNSLMQNNENQNTNNANLLMMNEQQLLMRLMA